MADSDGKDERQRALQQYDASGMQSRGQLQYYGDPGWHRGTDAYGNPVWYRAYGWSWQSPGGSFQRERDEEPHTHGRTQSRHYQRSDERIRDDIYDRLNDHPNVDSREIRVSVSGGEVTLEGTVHRRREKRLAEDIADGVPGVRDVQNRLRMTDQGGPGEDEAREPAGAHSVSNGAATQRGGQSATATAGSQTTQGGNARHQEATGARSGSGQ